MYLPACTCLPPLRDALKSLLRSIRTLCRLNVIGKDQDCNTVRSIGTCCCRLLLPSAGSVLNCHQCFTFLHRIKRTQGNTTHSFRLTYGFRSCIFYVNRNLRKSEFTAPPLVYHALSIMYRFLKCKSTFLKCYLYNCFHIKRTK